MYNFIFIYFFSQFIHRFFYADRCLQTGAKLDDFAESKRYCKGLLLSAGLYQYFWEICVCKNQNRYVEKYEASAGHF